MAKYQLLNYPLLMNSARLYDKLSLNNNKHNIHNENPTIKYKNYVYFELG